jgi:hypothetical protein
MHHYYKLQEERMAQLVPIRRVVVGEDADGQSYVEQDGPPTVIRTVPERPGFRSINLWATIGTPTSLQDGDRAREVQAILPPLCGTVLRILDYPPDPQDPQEAERRMKATFQQFNDVELPTGPMRHPGMHRTDSVDYAIVLTGEIYVVMDKGETLLREGDVLVLRGARHAWSNRSNEFCRVATVLIDAVRDEPRSSSRPRRF